MKSNLKTSLIVAVVALILSVFCACNYTYVPDGTFYTGMNTTEIFDILRQSKSYSLDINEEDKNEKYRFILSEGYTIAEEESYLCKFVEDGYIYTITYNLEDGYQYYKEVFQEKFYTEIQYVFDSYIDKLKDTFEEGQFELDTNIKIEIADDEDAAVIKYIGNNVDYELSIYEAYIFDVNESELYLMDEVVTYSRYLITNDLK